MKAKLLLFLGLSLLPAVGAAAQSAGRQKPNSHVRHHAKNVTLVYCDLHVCPNEKPHWFGVASYYGKHYWQGRKMANGERFDYRKLTAASWGIPLGTKVLVTNIQNGKSVVVEITDRGPAHSLHRAVDLSQAAAEALDYTEQGLTQVMMTPLFMFDPTPSPVEARLEEPMPDPPAVEAAVQFPDMLLFPEPVQPPPPAANELLTENFQY